MTWVLKGLLIGNCCGDPLSKKKKQKTTRCFNCAAKVTEAYYCYGCKTYVCDGCSLDDKMSVAHDPEDHLTCFNCGNKA